MKVSRRDFLRSAAALAVTGLVGRKLEPAPTDDEEGADTYVFHFNDEEVDCQTCSWEFFEEKAMVNCSPSSVAKLDFLLGLGCPVTVEVRYDCHT